MTVRELLNLAAKRLSRSKSASPDLDAEVLLSHVLDKPKEYLLANPGQTVSQKLEKRFHIFLTRRLMGWPVAYLAKKKEFYGLGFYVDENVLIPRPETEGLVELAMKTIGIKNGLNILDVGTGSGNIIVSVAKKLGSKNRYFASNISPAALLIAKKNAKQHKVKIIFKHGSLLTPWKKQHFDIIVANLLYLAEETDASTKFEPKQALIAEKKGLGLLEELFKQISFVIPAKAGIQTKSSLSGSRIKSGMTRAPQFLFLEIGETHGPAIKKLVKKYLPAFETKIYKDLSGFERFAILQNLSTIS